MLTPQEEVPRAELFDRISAQSGWPRALFDDPGKAPLVVHTREAFIEELMLGNHMDTIVVFKNGLKVLGLDDAVPDSIVSAVKRSSTVRDFLRALPADEQAQLKGRIYYCKAPDSVWRAGSEKELKVGEDGVPLKNLKHKTDHLLGSLGHVSDEHMYVAEIRRLERRQHPEFGDMVRTIAARDVKDVIPRGLAMLMPYWDRFDEGFFVGSALSGSPVHVDQVQWSNIGKNYIGHKLLAIWKYGRESFPFLDRSLREMYVPATAHRMGDLDRACTIGLVGPGDVFIFSGANPHAVLGVGDGLSLTGYESFVNLNPRHAQVLIETNKAPHYGECHAEESDVEDIKDDVVDALKDAIDHDADPKTHQGLRYSQALKGCVSVFQEDEAVAKQLAGYEPFPVPKRLKVG